MTDEEIRAWLAKLERQIEVEAANGMANSEEWVEMRAMRRALKKVLGEG